MKNLILGVAKGYSWDILEPFVISAKKYCPSADLVLFVDDISDFTREKLIRAEALLLNFQNESKSGIPNNTRWKIFSDFLEVHGDKYEQIFITDTCDVIFQGDIFEKFKGYKNYLGYATEADYIRGSKTGNKINYDWLVDCFGKDEADKLLDKKIICCGTIIGTTNEMKIFCRELWKVLEYKTTNIFDQAVTNYLVYNNLLPIKNLIEIDVDGEIFTIAFADEFSVRGDKILRGGKIPAVVHQYNRYGYLIGLVDEIYHDKNFQVDEHFTDMRSVIEQANCLLFANRIGEATKLFMKKFLVTTNFDDCIGALLRFWETAMKNPLSQASELIELSAQNALHSANKSFGSHLEKVCVLVKRARECNHPIDPEFKSYIVAQLLKLTYEKFSANERKQYLLCLELIVLVEGGQVTWPRN